MNKSEWTKAYMAFLGSQRGKEIRAYVLKRDRFECKSCRCTATQVHYLTREYGWEDTRSMVSLCIPCHGRANGRAAIDYRTSAVPDDEGDEMPSAIVDVYAVTENHHAQQLRRKANRTLGGILIFVGVCFGTMPNGQWAALALAAIGLYIAAKKNF